jgi:hypothetical protein
MNPAAPRDTTTFEVRDALGQPGCAVCRLALRSNQQYLRAVAYEQVNDPPLRQELRLSGGFCNPHAFQWLRDAHNVLGTALIYRDVLQSTARDLATTPQSTRLLRGLRGRAEKRRTCPACRNVAEAEARYLQALLNSADADRYTRTRVDASDGLCRRHAMAAARAGGPGAERIVSRTQQVVQALVDDLDEVIRKEDYRFQHEPRSEAERSAPSRAIAWAAAADGLISSGEQVALRM